ncbi:MAG: MFS transporter, partial [bacterium]
VSLGACALPAENMLLARYAPSAHHGVVFGLKFVLFFGSGPLGVVLVSSVTRRTGEFVWVFALLALVAAIICLAALALPRKTPPLGARVEVAA